MTEKKETTVPSGDEKADSAKAAAPEETAAEPAAARRSHARRVWAFVALVFGLTVLLPIGGGLYLMHKPFKVPGWAEEQIERALEAQGSGARIQLGDIYLSVGEGLRPWVDLYDTQVTQPDGAALARVNAMRVNLSGRSLLRGILAAEHISVGGLLVDLTRGRDGRFEMSFGEGEVPAERAVDFASLMAGMDTAFGTPELSGLSTIHMEGVTLRYTDLRAERAWTVDGGRFTVERSAEDLHMAAALTLLTGGATAATIEASYWRTIGEVESDFGLTVTDLLAQDIASQSPALSFFRALDAPLSGSLRGQVNAKGALDNLSASLAVGAGDLRPNRDARPIPFNSARTYFNYEPAQGLLLFDEISVNSDLLSGRAEGSARLIRDDGDDWPRAMVAQVRMSDLQVAQVGALPKEIDVQKADASFRLDIEDFGLDLGQMTVVLPEGKANMSGWVKASEGGWSLSLLAEADRISHDTVLSYWPEAKASKLRTWLGDNLNGGMLRKVQFHLAADPGERPEHQLDFAFEDASLRYLPEMPPITAAQGRAVLDRTRFALRLDGGRVLPAQGGPIDLSGSRYEIPKLGRPSDDAEVDLALSGTVTALMSALDQPPLRVASRANLPVTMADGRAKVQAHLTIPFKKGLTAEDVAYVVEADLTQVRSETLVKDRVLAFPALHLTAKPEGVEISGAGRFDSVPVDGTFTLPKGGTPRLRAAVELSERALDTLNVDLGAVRVSGTGTGQLDLRLPKNAPMTFALSSNLKGISLSLASLGWAKAQGTAADFSISGQINPLAVGDLQLSAPGLDLVGRLNTDSAGKVSDIVLSRLRAGSWLDSPVTISPRAGRPPLISLSGGAVTVTEVPKTSSSGGEGSPLRLNDMTIRLTDKLALRNFDGDFETTGGMRGTFAAQVNGGAPIEGLITPSRGRSAIRVTSEDGGDVMRDAGILKQANGGEMVLDLTPAKSEGQYDGVLSITNTRLHDAPAVTGLLNAVSVVGLVDQMANGGIYFSNVDADFRLAPNMFVLTKGSAVGPSMGLSLDGVVFLNENRMDMQGVLSPIYVLNGIGGFLTRAGEGLFGFNFTLKGPTNAPQVGVNPLSILTPGMFREIFRRPPPKVSQ